MTIYVAARYTEKPRARMVRATLVNRGFQVSSSWLYASTSTHPELSWREWAEMDLADLRRSDVFVLVEPHLEGGGGRYIEMGYALARRMPVLVWVDVATDSNDGRFIFYHLPQVTVYRTLPELVDALAAPAFRLIEGPIA